MYNLTMTTNETASVNAGKKAIKVENVNYSFRKAWVMTDTRPGRNRARRTKVVAVEVVP